MQADADNGTRGKDGCGGVTRCRWMVHGEEETEPKVGDGCVMGWLGGGGVVACDQKCGVCGL